MAEVLLVSCLMVGLLVAVREVYLVWRDRLCPRCGGVLRPEQFGSGVYLYCRGCAWRDEECQSR